MFCPWAHSSSYYSAKFSSAVASQGVRVLLVAPENFMAHLLSPKVERVRWPYIAPDRLDLASLLQSPIQALKLSHLIDGMQPDWIHLLWTHHVPVLLIPWLKKARVAYTAHDPVLHSGEAGMLRSWVQRKLIGVADVCFVHGEDNKKKLVAEYSVDPDRVYSIPHGEFMFWQDVPNVNQENLILFFGRIRKYKGLDVLLDAFQEVSPHIPDFRLVICGEGDLGDLGPRIRTMTNVDVVKRFIDHSEIPSLFLRSRFLVLPYLDGTQSGVVPMAFALGRTCVVSAVGAIPEVVHHDENGLLVRPGDPRELANAIIRLARDDKLRHRLEEGALRSARSSHALSWERAARIAAGVYKSAILGFEE
ncbi:MAG: glycosyltransferase family 4 protein [Anaerolineae bacterium]